MLSDRKIGDSYGRLDQLEQRMHDLASRHLHLVTSLTQNAATLKQTCDTVQMNRKQMRSLWGQLRAKRTSKG